jgi:N4-gp56 family major capsid protein
MINTTVVANTIQPHYSKKLLARAVQLTRLVNSAQQEDLPAGHGSTSVRFFRPEVANLGAFGAPAALTEGTAPTNYRTITYTPVDVPLSQRGQVARVSDVANTVGLLKYLDDCIDLMSEEFALDVDTYIRNPLCHSTVGLNKRYAQGLPTFAGLAGATAANGRMVARDLLDACTQLRINRAPTFGGFYAANLPPQIIRDLMNDAEFREVIRQNDAEKIFKGEIGDYYGCRVVDWTNPFQEDETEGTFAPTFNPGGTNTTGLIYSGIITGKGSYGTVNMAKMGSSMQKPMLIINNKPDKTDPLGQWTTAGWKAYTAATVLNPTFGLVLRAKTQFV